MPFLNKRLTRFLQRPWHDKLNSLHAKLARLKTELYYRQVFGTMGRGCLIYKPLLLSNPRFVHIGDRTMIRKGARIEVIVLDEAQPPSLVIGNNVNIEQNVHLICSSSLVIGDNVTIVGNCAIVDTRHPFRDVKDQTKIGDRIDATSTPVHVGENSFLGYGCVILPGVHIGKHCVIGANSTVRGDVPDYSVVAGNPATVVMYYDFENNVWQK